MNRQIVQAPKERTLGEAGTRDGYMERLLKLIPGETVAMYLFLQGVIQSGLGDQTDQLKIWLWAIVAILAVGNVFYLKQFQGVTHAPQIIILTIAFFVWIMTIGGPFTYFSWYEPFMGSVILGLFTFFAPMMYTGKPVNGSNG